MEAQSIIDALGLQRMANALKRFGVARTIFELLLMAAIVLLAHGNAPRIRPSRESIIFSIPTRERVVALTYDDGPHPVFTPELLRVLDQYHVKATFFMIGSCMEQYPDLVKAVHKAGHVIGNHTFTHPRNLELETQARMIREMDRCEEVIEHLTSGRAELFRPPRGLANGTVLMIAREEGYKTVLWSISAYHHDARTPEAMARRVLDHIHPGGIVLAHDGTLPMRWRDVKATPLIIEDLRKRGYRFVTVPELLEIVGSRRGTEVMP